MPESEPVPLPAPELLPAPEPVPVPDETSDPVESAGGGDVDWAGAVGLDEPDGLADGDGVPEAAGDGLPEAGARLAAAVGDFAGGAQCTAVPSAATVTDVAGITAPDGLTAGAGWPVPMYAAWAAGDAAAAVPGAELPGDASEAEDDAEGTVCPASWVPVRERHCGLPACTAEPAAGWAGLFAPGAAWPPADGAAAAGEPFPSTSEEAPSTLADCPPVSTLELTWTSVCRSGATDIVTPTTKATAVSTAAGRKRASSRGENQSASRRENQSGRDQAQ